jgi:spermidine synthase
MLSRVAPYALFYVSGIAGLIYQVLWLRRLSVVFGVTVYAASTVLAAFMAGLAIGAALSGRVMRRGTAPLAAFGIAEILIGITGFLSPVLLDAASAVYVALHGVAPESLSALTIARLVCSFAILVVPTTMMGITLPLLTAAVSQRSGSAGSRVSLLYALNTLGAMSGTLLTGYILIPAIGIQKSFLLAAALNVLVGTVALLLNKSRDASIESTIDNPQSAIDHQSSIINLKLLWLVVAVSGFASLGLEIVWFRLMLQFVTATTEAFTAMLTTVLGGIALGGLVAAVILRSRRELSAALGMAQAMTGISAVMSMSFLLWTVKNGWETMDLWPAVLIAILGPSFFMGLGFPLALGIAARSTANREELTRRIGGLYSLNVAGAIIGSLAAGFVLLPKAGSVDTLIALGAMFVISGLWVAITRRNLLRWSGALVLATAFFLIARDLPDPFRVAIDRRYGNMLLEFWREEGAQTAVSVHASQYQHVLYLDGLHQANDQPAMVALHRSIGHLPMVLHGAPKDVLVVGMGGGATPGAVSQHAGANVQVVELSDSVRKAAPFFAHVNYDLLNRKNVNIRIDDGRNFLSLTRRRFDVITADIIQPGHAGAGHVYSKEYFTLVRNALKEDGVALQWIGHRPFVEYTLIMRTFLEVFPDATLWHDANFMVGTRKPLAIDPRGLDRMRQHPETRDALDAVGLKNFEILRNWYTAGPEEMRAFVGEGPVLTDDRPLVEYHHWLPRPEEQPPLNLSSLKGDVNRAIAAAPSLNQ